MTQRPSLIPLTSIDEMDELNASLTSNRSTMITIIDIKDEEHDVNPVYSYIDEIRDPKLKDTEDSSSGFNSGGSDDVVNVHVDQVDEEDCLHGNRKWCQQNIIAIHQRIEYFFTNHGHTIKKGFYILMLLCYVAFVVMASYFDVTRATPLLVISGLFVFCCAYWMTKTKCSASIGKTCLPLISKFTKRLSVIKWLAYVLAIAGVVAYLLLYVGTDPNQYSSLAGLCVFLLLLWLFSKHPTKVNPRPVLLGLQLQFLVALLVLRTSWGLEAFNFLGGRLQKFLAYTHVGSKFVFGLHYEEHLFAFKVMPVVIMFCATISALYYLGIMQAIIGKIAWLMQKTLQTSATESLVAAGNIFIGQTEAPILVRPFINDMTKSELHAMMTAGYATIAGSVLAAYILFGVSAQHLICASVMNAPMSLAVSKLFYPETEKSKTFDKNVSLNKSSDRSLLESISSGVSQSLPLVANIVGNLIAFLALLAFINAVVSWFGAMVDHPEWTFQLLCGYIFMPFAYLMGVDSKDCLKFGELLGMKTFLNEFVAYEELSRLINARKSCTDSGLGHLSPRSEVIATYALCGFSNLSSVGVQIGGIGALAPSRRADVAQLAVRALVAGTTVCFITACIAGVLVVPDEDVACWQNATDIVNTTLSYNSTLN